MRIYSVLLALALIALPLPVFAEPPMHHPQKDMQMHTEFYQYWKKSDGKSSCCGKGDCYPTAAHFDKKSGLWWAMRKQDKKWIEIPKSVYDNDDPEAPQSPDGRSHLCAPAPPDSSTANATGPYSYSEMKGTPVEVYCFRPGMSI